MATRIGVDIGGTFTDLIYYDDVSGESLVAKVPTTPDNPDEGVVTAIGQAVPADRVKAAEYFLHGTTVGINALLQRRGAVVGLLATEGFRDILEIRRGDREEMYNLFWTPPPPLVPRRLRRPVKERVRANGEIHIAQETADVREALSVFESEDVDAIAIAYMNAYANPVHEIEAERELRAAGFEGEISVSHRVSGEYREYERTTTTVIDAFVRPRMIHYLRRLDEELANVGFVGRLLITRSGGGSMTFAEAEERPFETIMSGPVAGAEGAGELARSLGIDNLITADVGGTSFDTCLVSGGRPQLMYEGMVVGLPVQTPWVDVRSIGAGGGSIAYIDVGGLLQVGPQSAGADPGPASYGRGGTEPTVTDCALSLGMLGEGKLASGNHARCGQGTHRHRADRREVELHHRSGRPRCHDHRDRLDGQHHPRDYHRPGRRPATGDVAGVRRRRPVDGLRSRPRAEHRKHRDPALCRQLLGVGAAGGRPDPGRGADQDHEALG